MKKPMMILAVATAVLFTACGEEKKEEEGNENGKTSENKPEESGDDKEDVLAGGVYNVNPEESHIMWMGWNREKPEDHKHEGTINLSGTVEVADGKVTGGMMEAHLETIVATDLEGKEKQQNDLKGHFMSPEFFAMEESEPSNPTIKVVNVTEEGVQVEITARGMTTQTLVPATVTIDGDQLMASSGEFEVNFLPFEMPFFAQEKEAENPDDHVTILNPSVKFSGLKIVASK